MVLFRGVFQWVWRGWGGWWKVTIIVCSQVTTVALGPVALKFFLHLLKSIKTFS